MSHTLIQDALFTAKSSRELDRLAREQQGIAGTVLMKRAARAALAELLDAFGTPSLLTVFCGSGNNGGDGYVLAALAAEKNITVQCIELGASLGEDATQAKQFAEQARVSFRQADSHFELDQGVIVDSLLGTGYEGELREPYAKAIALINDSGLPVLAMDIPSGLNCDTGAVASVAVKADMTLTFIAAKQGLFTGRGPSLCGEVIYDSLEVEEDILNQVIPSAALMDLDELLGQLPEDDADLYKNQRGHGMVIGGDHSFGGAVIIAVEGCLKVGAGLASVATRPEHVSAVLARQPEVMACGVTSGQQLEPLLDRPSVLIIGPGLGLSSWSEQLMQKAVAANLPMVIDADGLNILAQGRVVPKPDGSQWVLTPHVGEAARLLGVTVAEIQSDRFAAVSQLQQKYNAVVLLKGPGTLVSNSQGKPIKICPYGNSSMATAGMGDMLSGIIGGLMAQGLSPQMAAELGCCLHSSAADMAAEDQGSRGLVTSDLLPYIRSLLNSLDQEAL